MCFCNSGTCMLGCAAYGTNGALCSINSQVKIEKNPRPFCVGRVQFTVKHSHNIF